MLEFTASGCIVTIDEVDADLAELRWNVVIGIYGYPQIMGCVKVDGRWRNMLLARTILERVHNRPLKGRCELTDHKDTNPFNNRRDNLRIATPIQNTVNSKRRSDNRSGYKGVHATGYKDPAKQFSAQCGGKWLGCFPTAEQAHAAYCNAAVERWGEFANFGETDHA